jgi:hypothetical protein
MRRTRQFLETAVCDESSTSVRRGHWPKRFDCSVGIKRDRGDEIEGDVANYYQFICFEKSFAEAKIYYIDTTIRNIRCMSLA